ncbi:MAG: PQQ-binding-like beta-propeller repeat protein [Thermoguttaceae bacterium]
MMRSFFPFAVLVLCFSMSWICAEEWKNWRGNTFNGRSNETNLPTNWSEESNILWKTAIPAWGASTPIVLGDSIFFTTHENDSSPEGRMAILHLNKTTGNIVWKREVAKGRAPRAGDGEGMRRWQKFNDHHNFASPSVVGDAEVIIAHFGEGTVAALDWDGNILWKINMQKDFGDFKIWWGHANSPVLFENNVIIPVMHDNLADLDETPNRSYIASLDKMTGKLLWKTDRTTLSKDEYSDAYTSPILWNHEGRTELVFLGSERMDAYEPKTGKLLWWIGKGLEGNRIVPTPSPNEELGMIFAARGKRDPAFGFAPRGLGEQSETAIKWYWDKNVPDVCSMVSTNKFVFFIDDKGVMTCLDSKSGEKQWAERLEQGTYFPSLLLANDRIYVLNRAGTCSVVSASETFEKIAENKLSNEFYSSPITSDGCLILRGKNAIYCIGTPK